MAQLARNPRLILAAQAIRALAYGFSAVLLGVTLNERNWSSVEAGLLLTAIVAGSALMSVLVGTFGDRIGRRRAYGLLYAGLAPAGIVFALSDSLPMLIAVAMVGTLSTDVIESGPFTSLEQAMLASSEDAKGRTRLFSLYNAVAAIAGSLGALLAFVPRLLGDVWSNAPSDQRYFLAFVLIGALGLALARTLDDGVEQPSGTPRAPLVESRGAVTKLAALFAVDSFAGGFVIQSFIAYWFGREFDLSLQGVGVLFFFVGLLQAASFLAASPIAERFGLLNTMVFTHIPSNLLLMCIPLAPTLTVAIAFLLARQALSQMDVPTRQAFLANLVPPGERTAAAAYTNSARYAVRPFGPLLAGAAQQVAVGLPFFVAGGLKIAYDVTIWNAFRNVALEGDADPAVAVDSGEPPA